MSEPHQLDPPEFHTFIAGPAPAVVLLAVHPAHPFNRLLCERFAEDEGTAVAFARLALMDLLTGASAASVLAFLHREIAVCGAAVPFAVPPGYYLFRHGQLLAWDSGLPAAADLKRIFMGSLPGAALSLLTRDAGYLRTAALFAADAAAAERLAWRFRYASAAWRENPRPAPPGAGATLDGLAHAYRVLGIAPGASDGEVNRAWSALLRQYHPDRAARDPQESDRLSRLCMEINRARDTIRRHRRGAATG